MFTATAKSLLMASVACTIVGCGGPPTRDSTASGTVLVDGQLAERGTVTFHPLDGGPLAVGRVHSDGTYTVRTGQGDLSDVDRGTLKSGDYKVTVVVYGEPGDPIVEGGPPKAGPRLTAAKYSSVATTDLERKVNPGDNLFIFELDGASISEPADEEPTSESLRANAAEGEQADNEPGEQSDEPASSGEPESTETRAESSKPEAAETEAAPSEPEATEAKPESSELESTDAADKTSRAEAADAKDNSSNAKPEEAADESGAAEATEAEASSNEEEQP